MPGLDAAAAAAFLETDELVDEVWESCEKKTPAVPIRTSVASFARTGGVPY